MKTWTNQAEKRLAEYLEERVRREGFDGEEADVVLWLHGPQAVGLSQTEALLQMLGRGTRVPVIHSVMAVAGPNRLAEPLHRSGVLRRGAALLDPRADLAAFVKKLAMEHDAIAWHWRRSSSAPSIPGVPEPSSALLVMIGGAAALMRRRRNRPDHE